jgi:hypothetical protein
MRVPSPRIATALALLILGACGDSNAPPDDSRDFTGSYTLLSFAQGTSASVIVVPGATGTFVMTATTYDASVTVPSAAGPINVDDTGTYTANGTLETGTWTQQSDDGSLQSTGTYTWDPALEQLTLDTSSIGQRSVLVLQRN